MIGRRPARAARRRPWREAPLLAVDFEATTADPRSARPLSVAWVPVDAGRVRLAGAGYALLRHDGALAHEGIAVHGLLPGDVAAGHPPAAVAATLSAALRTRLMVAHGAQLELALLARLGVPADRRRTVDTMSLTGRLDALEDRSAPDRRDLPGVAARFGVLVGRAHHAFSDALSTALLLLVLARRFERHGSGRIDDLLRVGRPA